MNENEKKEQLMTEIEKELPNFPREIIEQWLLPFAEDYGWPPNEEWREKWQKTLTLSLEEWRNMNWKLETWDMTNFPLSFQGQACLTGMQKCYWLGEENTYTKLKTEGNGLNRHLRALQYILEHGEFPFPIVAREDFDFAFLHGLGGFRLMDGNHRLLAWHTAAKLHQELAELPDERIEQCKKELKISNIVPLSVRQEVWIARFNENLWSQL